MESDPTRIQQVFSKNRAEEFGYDVWREFVVPLFYDQVDLKNATKPQVLIGGRGCGKTMLIRYLSYHSTFSPHRTAIDASESDHVGLYWKADTQFCKMLAGRNMPEDIWAASFEHALAILLGSDLLASLGTIAASKCPVVDGVALDKLDFCELRHFIPTLGGSYRDLTSALRASCWSFQMWANNPKSDASPSFLPGRLFLHALLTIVRSQIPALAKSRFCVYIDEYENLRDYQKRIINTCVKHSEQGLLFSIATKRHGMTTRSTVSDEQITDTADYRSHDLDEYLHGHEFDLFAAEILFLRLSMAGAGDSPVKEEELREPSKLANRRRPEYRQAVLARVKQMLPQLSHFELAKGVFDQPALVNKLKRDVGKALVKRASTLKAEDFVRSEQPEASIICPALLNRPRLTPDIVLKELVNLDAKRDNRFDGTTGWIHNNFIGCLLQLYAPHDRACPFYAGFDSFIQLSHGNIRHFLELWYKSLRIRKSVSPVRVEPNEQAEAARQASAALLSEIRSFGQMGNRLHSFILTLGAVFHMVNRRLTQSEPEISHFSVKGGLGGLSQDEQSFMLEAAKWSVLFEEAETKIKDSSQMPNSEWVLNPIYSPYFHITYRKKRKIELGQQELSVMIGGGVNERRELLKHLASKWAVESDNLELPLFSYMQIGSNREV